MAMQGSLAGVAVFSGRLRYAGEFQISALILDAREVDPDPSHHAYG